MTSMAFQRQEYLKRITTRLAILENDISMHNQMGMYDINLFAENLYAGLLNIIFGWELENVNQLAEKIPGIDLIDQENRIMIQISVNNSSAKIRHTIESCLKSRMDIDGYHLIMLFICRKRIKYSSVFNTEGKIDFDVNRDIWDNTTIIQYLNSAYVPIRTLQHIVDYLEAELIDNYTTVNNQNRKHFTTKNVLEEFWISSVSTRNYRGFVDKSFLLNKHMNVLAGKNGTGKTTSLEAINVLLGIYLDIYEKYISKSNVYMINGDDPHLQLNTSTVNEAVQADSIPQYPCVVSGDINWKIDGKNIQMNAERRIPRQGAYPHTQVETRMITVIHDWEYKLSEADEVDKEIVLPIVLYLSSARLWYDFETTTNEHIPNRTDGYDMCLNPKHGISFAFDYIRKLRMISLEEKDSRSDVYNTLLLAVNRVLKDELSEREEVVFSSRLKRDVLGLKKKDGSVIPFNSLSDGYRNVIRIVLDIAVRMCILNPYLRGNALQDTPGIVLIDEIDLSLHPTWQKRIIKILKDIFPKVQFICATHSPFIIQSLEEGELINLDNSKNDSKYSGEGIEDIAEQIMNVAMPQYSEKRRKMFEAAKEYIDAVNKGENAEDLEKLRIYLTRLEAEYSDNPAYLALLQEKYDKKEWDIIINEANSKK